MAAQIDTIELVQTESYWKDVNVNKLEQVRVAMRDLIQYLESETQEHVYTSFEDDIDFEGIVVREPIKQHYLNLQSYKDRVERYVRRTNALDH